MKSKTALALTTLALAAAFSFSAPAIAQEGSAFPELMAKAADMNKDGMISKQEYLDQMAKVWDEKHGKMMKTDKTMKAGMMDMKQYMAMLKAFYRDPNFTGGGN